MRPARSWVDAWLPLYFALHAGATVGLIALLGVRADRYHLLPPAFGLAAGVALVPSLRERLLVGPWPWRALPPLFYVGVISLASSVAPQASVPVEGNAFHPVEYAALGFLVQAAVHRGFRRAPGLSRVGLGILLCALAGGLDELHQAAVPGRASTWVDVGLDALGGTLGAALYWGADRLLGRYARAGAQRTVAPAAAAPPEAP